MNQVYGLHKVFTEHIAYADDLRLSKTELHLMLTLHFLMVHRQTGSRDQSTTTTQVVAASQNDTPNILLQLWLDCITLSTNDPREISL